MCYGFLFVAVLVLGGNGRQAADSIDDEFLQRVTSYVALHREIEARFPPQVVSNDMAALFRGRRALADAIRKERANAHQGDIFTLALVRHFQMVVGDALRRAGINDMLAIVNDENEVHLAARVNAEYPAGASVSLMPPCVLAALPHLPPELEYRFLGRDLILWDVHAGLIVDFVPGAIPAAADE